MDKVHLDNGGCGSSLGGEGGESRGCGDVGGDALGDGGVGGILHSESDIDPGGEEAAAPAASTLGNG